MKRKRPKDSLLSRLARPFAAFGRKTGDAAPDSPASAEDEDEDAVSDSIVEDSFTLALNTLLTEDQGRFHTKLHLISLVEFREAVGSKWYRLSEKVMLIAEGVINLHLGAGNVYGRRGQDFFILLFRNLPEAEGRRRAVLIAQELGTRLVGAQFVGAERPLALAAEIALDAAIGPDGQLDLDAIHGAVGEVRAIIASAATTGYRPHLTALPTEDDLRIHHSALPAPLPEQGDLRAHLRPSKLTTKDFTPRRSMLPGGGVPEKTGPQQVAAPSWTAVEIAGTGKPGGGADPAIDAAPPMPGDAALSLAWRPTWIAADETIGAYKAQVHRVDAPGETAWEGCRAYPPGGGETAVALDRYAIGAAVRELRSPETARSNAVAVLPIHWSSVDSPHRLGLLAPLGDLSEDLRAKRLIIDLFGIPDGAMEGPLTSTILALRPLCREVSLRVRLSYPRAAHAAACGVTTIGVDLSELPAPERTEDDKLLRLMTGLRKEAAAAGLGVYAWGIRRRTVVVGCVTAGFAMINGPGLMKDLPRPAKVLPAPKARLTGTPG